MKAMLVLTVFILLLPVISLSKPVTIKGNYCGMEAGNRSGAFGFRVGKKVVVLYMNFGQRGGNAKMIRFNVNKLKVGDEFIIVYEDENEDAPFITKITGTGKIKKISPCQLF